MSTYTFLGSPEFLLISLHVFMRITRAQGLEDAWYWAGVSDKRRVERAPVCVVSHIAISRLKLTSLLCWDPWLTFDECHLAMLPWLCFLHLYFLLSTDGHIAVETRLTVGRVKPYLDLHKNKCLWCYKDPLKGLDLDTTFRLWPGDLS